MHHSYRLLLVNAYAFFSAYKKTHALRVGLINDLQGKTSLLETDLKTDFQIMFIV